MKKPKILVLCTGNSCRSQIAEGWLKHFAGDRMDIFSAGIEAHGVNPRAIRTMGEVGIDISKQTSNRIEEYKKIDFDYIITVCDHARENCPYFPSNAQRLHHNFPDPAKASGTEMEIEEEFRKVRSMIRDYIQDFLSDLNRKI
ncbi:arsenate reductase ArsC [Leptospira kmetyi]|uniref:Protein tyrosine phosphatase n=1 Tax=Leptospira kmetyi TaxID=408139 RepID=A0ABX4NHJ3_9LEPT|nr:arsenate reductase ArsC [Leptospira kmetyi]PJZ31649.1 protein tyrosine phosphatase [Leptospira kmetyi]PJZ43414.1 protein tyrosine phosphatase [Leptospira kmetyi]TGK21716.1 arsenate reductase ArsC [Leptospira kmetyi]TGK28643.1 arsenate reductase ArsC [Leptospira kmetyi]TGL67989.1 arsenate reductase ArsC [Leptospira kmetyi]